MERHCFRSCRETGVAENVTEQERGEEHAFLAAVCDSRPMQYVHQYLARKVTLLYSQALHAGAVRLPNAHA